MTNKRDFRRRARVSLAALLLSSDPAMSLAKPRGKILAQEARGKDEAVLASLREVRFLFSIGNVPEIVFVLDRETSVEAGLQEHSDELGPVEEPLPRNAIAPPALAVDSHLLEHRLDDLRVLGVTGQNAVAEMPRRGDGIDVLPDEVRGIEFEAQAVVGHELTAEANSFTCRSAGAPGMPPLNVPQNLQPRRCANSRQRMKRAWTFSRSAGLG